MDLNTAAPVVGSDTSTMMNTAKCSQGGVGLRDRDRLVGTQGQACRAMASGASSSLRRVALPAGRSQPSQGHQAAQLGPQCPRPPAHCRRKSKAAETAGMTSMSSSTS